MVDMEPKQSILSRSKVLEGVLEKAGTPVTVAIQFALVSLLAYLIAF